MRRSIFKLMAVFAVAAATVSPAVAKDIKSTLPKHVEPPPGPPPVVAQCDPALVGATACSGYFEKNLFGGDSDKVAAQIAGVSALPGTFEWDGNWANIDANWKIESLQNGNQMNFGTTLYGLTIIGAHFGNVDGPAKNTSVFWLFDFGTQGANFVALSDPSGWSNAVLYTTASAPPVPEPATWAMMLVGFGFAGAALRRSRRKTGQIPQIA